MAMMSVRMLRLLQAFYREELYKTVLGFKDLEDFMKNFWEKWALSKGIPCSISSLFFFSTPLIYSLLFSSPTPTHTLSLSFHPPPLTTPPKRPRKPPNHAPHLAIGRRLRPIPLQWRLRRRPTSHPSPNPRSTWANRFVFPVRIIFLISLSLLHLSLFPLSRPKAPPLTSNRPEDSAIEISLMRPGIGKLDVFPSIWGHWAGGPGDSKEDVKWLNEKLVEVGL